MRKILYILLVTMVATMVVGCRTACKVVAMHDTLTIERAVVQEVYKHDTLTIHDSTEIVREVVRYDTLGRITETMRERLRNGKVESRGEAMQSVTSDTIYITRTLTKTLTKSSKPKQSRVPGIILACVLLGVLGYVVFKSWKL